MCLGTQYKNTHAHTNEIRVEYIAFYQNFEAQTDRYLMFSLLLIFVLGLFFLSSNIHIVNNQASQMEMDAQGH